MGSIFKKTPMPKQDLQKADYREAVNARTAAARDAQLALLSQLEKQTGGVGPSVVGEESKVATSRNLKELLAAAAASRTPTAQQNVIRAGGAAGRETAAASGKARAQEMQAFQQLRARTGVGQQAQDLAQIMEPGRVLAEAEMQRYQADIERQKRVRESQAALRGGFITGASKIFAGMTGGSPAEGIQNPSGYGNVGHNATNRFVGPGGPNRAYVGPDMFSDKKVKKEVKSGKRAVESFLEAINKKGKY